MVLRYAGVEYVEKQYVFREGSDFEAMMSHWLEDKHHLGLAFPNLPYWIDEDVKLTQSIAILNYVGEKYGVAPTTLKGKARAMQVEQLCMDIINAEFKILYPEEAYIAGKAGHVEQCKVWVEQLSQYLGQSHFICGEQVVAADFLLQETLARIELIEPGTIDSNLSDYDDRMKALPQLQQFYNSEAGQNRLGISGPMAAVNSIDDYHYAPQPPK